MGTAEACTDGIALHSRAPSVGLRRDGSIQRKPMLLTAKTRARLTNKPVAFGPSGLGLGQSEVVNTITSSNWTEVPNMLHVSHVNCALFGESLTHIV